MVLLFTHIQRHWQARTPPPAGENSVPAEEKCPSRVLDGNQQVSASLCQRASTNFFLRPGGDHEVIPGGPAGASDIAYGVRASLGRQRTGPGRRAGVRRQRESEHPPADAPEAERPCRDAMEDGLREIRRPAAAGRLTGLGVQAAVVDETRHPDPAVNPTINETRRPAANGVLDETGHSAHR